MNGHDQAFKHLLQTFFPEFLEAFVPELRVDLQLKSIQFLDKELIRGPSGAQRTKLVDLVARVSFRSQAGFILVHVEHSAKRNRETTERLFLYAAGLIERYHLPVYPILLTSYDEPRTPESDRYLLEVRGLRVIDFHCRVVQLNRLDWREFARLKNPAATALMAKMRIEPEDRVRAKLQILRLLATMRLNPIKMDLIAGFMENYLAFTRKEELAFMKELDKVSNSKEKRDVMELMTSWERKGLEKGRREGEVEVIQRQLRAKFGSLSPSLSKKVQALSEQRLKQLAADLLKFQQLRDLERWL